MWESGGDKWHELCILAHSLAPHTGGGPWSIMPRPKKRRLGAALDPNYGLLGNPMAAMAANPFMQQMAAAMQQLGHWTALSDDGGCHGLDKNPFTSTSKCLAVFCNKLGLNMSKSRW